jgi:Carboxypeptidase regulatory-like domain/Quinohemoprotein amine dehydrogenase, alpha subunit domain III
VRARRTIRNCLIVGLGVALAAPAAHAYQFFSETGGASPSRWVSLPIALTVDNGPTDISTEIATALTTWNNVPTAHDPWGTATKAVDGTGTAVDFTGANFGTAWGDLTGDGNHEVVFDETGSALRALGLAPASVNGIGESHATASFGNSTIDDMYLVVNGTRSNFDRQATEIHELGHTLGLAHSSVGWSAGTDGALSAILESQSPTMHPYSIAGTDRRTLEVDDVAALSELYPEPSFSATTGTITGTVTRCGTNEPVSGANVRAINLANPAIQLTRVTGFDGETDGSYTIKGVPPGDYKIVVEPLSGDADFLSRLAMFTPVDTGFQAEFINESVESDCGQDTDPNASEDVPVGATGTALADAKVAGASLALVVDVTGSMGPEIGAIKTALNTMVTALDATPGSFPLTSIVTFDDAAQVSLTSRDPDRLREVIAGLTTHSTADCPEASNAALMTAGRLLDSGGRAVLVTDAESRPNGPSRQRVDSLFSEKDARLSVLLSGSCPPGLGGAAATRTAAPRVTWSDTAPVSETPPDVARPVDELGVEGDIRTFTEESLFSGGLFSFQPEIKGGTAAATERYSNTLANLAISAVQPAVAAVNPTAVPQGTTLDVELSGANTGFRAGSTVAVSGTGVAVGSTEVLSPTHMIVRLTAAASAPLGFRDVTVSTDRGDGSVEAATGIGPLRVVGPPSGPTVLSVTPSTVQAGKTANVTISGGSTHFAAGNSAAALGDGVAVNSLTVNSPTSAVANVTASAGAAIGFRDVSVQTGGELASESGPGPLLVVAAPPPVARLTAANPAAGTRGSTVDVTLTGANTTFKSGQSLVSLSGTGVQLVSAAVSGPTSLVARFAVASNAPLGFRDLRVTTGAEHAVLPDGFEVRPVPGGGRPGGGGGPPGTCTDRSRPAAKFLKGSKGVHAVRRTLHLRGRATDQGCAAAIPVAGKVARVEVAISRSAGGRRCSFVAPNGRLGRSRRCSKPTWLKARGTTTWALDTRRRLPRAVYTLQVRSRDAAGNLQARPATRTQRVR